MKCFYFWLYFILGVFTDPRAAGEWIKLNHKQFGFYRVNYDKQRWLDLAEQLDTDHEVSGKTRIITESPTATTDSYSLKNTKTGYGKDSSNCPSLTAFMSLSMEVKILIKTFESDSCFENHIAKVYHACYYHLHDFKQNCKFISGDIALFVPDAVVSGQLDYWNSFFNEASKVDVDTYLVQ